MQTNWQKFMNKKNKPLILITNDDGIQAKGIRSLIEAVRPLGDIVVLAPDGMRSGMSSAITAYVPIRLSIAHIEDGLIEYACTGTPVDCVKLAMNEILDRRPDLIISGINHGSNSAVCVIYSGTMGAALEGSIFGIPSFGISLAGQSSKRSDDFTNAAYYAHKIAAQILAEGLPPRICLNVNVPDQPEIKGMKICSQTEGQWTGEFMKANDPLGKDVYWLTGEFQNAQPHDTTTDEWALNNGYVAIVPCTVDMTSYETIDLLKHWEK